MELPYNKTPHFDVTREVAGRHASLSAYMRTTPVPGNTIDFVNRAREIPENTDTDFEWREFQVDIASGTFQIDLMGDGYGELGPTDEDIMPIFGADRDFALVNFPISYNLGNLHMTLSEFVFTANATVTIKNIILRGLKNTSYSWSVGSRPVMYYRVYMGVVVTELASISGTDDAIYPWPGGTSSNTVTLVSTGEIVIDGSVPSSETYRINIPINDFPVTSSTKYAIYFVPVGVAGALGMDINVTTRNDAGGQVDLHSNAVRMTVRNEAEATGILQDPQAGTAVQHNHYPDIVMLAGIEGVHSIQFDVDGNALDIIKDGGLDPNQILIAGAANRTEGGVAVPLPYAHDLKYDNFSAIAKVDPRSTVNFLSDDGRTIPEIEYKIVSNSDSSREDNLDAYKTTIFMAEEVTNSSVLTKAKYTRILDGETQVNFKDIVDPKFVAKKGVDYFFFISPAFNTKVIVFASDGSLGDVGDNDSVWIKKTPINAINALPPIGSPRSSWKPRISLGSFLQCQVKTQYGYKDIEYAIPDVSGYPVAVNWAQGFGNPAASGNPFLSKATREPVYVIDRYTLELPRSDIYFWDGNWASGHAGGNWTEGVDSYPAYDVPNLIDSPVVVGDSSEAKWSHGINIYLRPDILMDNTNIYGWNQKNGVLKLRRPVDELEPIAATYLYEQKEVEIDVDMNPTIGHPNGDRVGDTVRVVLKPFWDTYASDTGDATASGIYNRRLAWHWLSDNDTGEYIYDFPESSGTAGHHFSDGGLIGLPEHTIILGDYSIGQSTPFEANLIDTRVRGGGIKEDDWFTGRRQMQNLGFWTSPHARRGISTESEYYWDIGHLDGEPYQADGSLIISIPSTTMSSIQTRIVDDGVGETKITPEDKITVDAVFDASGNYDLEVILAGVGESHRKIAMKQYVGLREIASEMAIEEIREKIDKHVALGEFYVLVDESGETLDDANTISNAVSRLKQRRSIGGGVEVGGDPSREISTATRIAFPNPVKNTRVRGL